MSSHFIVYHWNSNSTGTHTRFSRAWHVIPAALAGKIYDCSRRTYFISCKAVQRRKDGRKEGRKICIATAWGKLINFHRNVFFSSLQANKLSLLILWTVTAYGRKSNFHLYLSPPLFGRVCLSILTYSVMCESIKLIINQISTAQANRYPVISYDIHHGRDTSIYFYF